MSAPNYQLAPVAAKQSGLHYRLHGRGPGEAERSARA
jgi:hypothetical protein